MTALKEKILRTIRATGPITLADYMRMALYDPDHGYYMRRQPLGAPTADGGDFITSPEVSQIFGEMLGVALLQAWEDRGRPAKLHLVELGPGRGTMMADILRAARIRPEFLAAAHVTLIETSPSLRDTQARNLALHKITWAENLETVAEDAPIFAVANEFFDALPIRQFVKGPHGWHERMIAERDGALAFALTPEKVPDTIVPASVRSAAPGAVFDLALAARNAMRALAKRVTETNGVALAIDYGHAQTGVGDSFQAMRAHDFADPLAEPGMADLTSHVDFEALAFAAHEEGAAIFGPVTQGAFLISLGARERAAQLAQKTPEESSAIAASLDRLIGPDAMGTLFKVLGIVAPQTPALAGF